MLKQLRILLLAPALLMGLYSEMAVAEVMKITQVYVFQGGTRFDSFFSFKNPTTGNVLNCYADRSEQADKLLLYMAQGKTVNVSCGYVSWANKYLLSATY